MKDKSGVGLSPIPSRSLDDCSGRTKAIVRKKARDNTIMAFDLNRKESLDNMDIIGSGF
ncbi:hypothetical protein ACFL0D_00670 [Thermoproteota archaeon]